jgi:hypothetical protein
MFNEKFSFIVVLIIFCIILPIMGGCAICKTYKEYEVDQEIKRDAAGILNTPNLNKK